MGKPGRKPGFRQTEETKRKIGLAALGKKHSEQTKRKISKANRGKKRTPEAKLKMRRAALGRKDSPETREKKRQGQLGKKHKMTPEGSATLSKKAARQALGFAKYKGFHYSLKMMRKYPYRSEFERRYMELLDNDPGVEKWDYEPFFVWYEYQGRKRPYLPDFFVKRADRLTLVEVKPKACCYAPINKAKWAAATEYCKQKGWAFEVITEDYLDSMLISSQAGRTGHGPVGRKVQRIPAEDIQTGKAGTSARDRQQANSLPGYDIFPSSGETRSSGIKRPEARS